MLEPIDMMTETIIYYPCVEWFTTNKGEQDWASLKSKQ